MAAPLGMAAGLILGIGTNGHGGPVTPVTAADPMMWDRETIPTRPNGLPILHSRPGAPVSLFIDFEYTSVDGKFSPFTLDADHGAFSKEEQQVIRVSWAKVAAAFAPFDVDVTTVEPDPKHPFIWQALVPGGAGSSGTTCYVPLSGQKTAANGSQRADGYRFCGQVGHGRALGWTLIHEGGHAHGIVGHESYDEDGNYIGIQRAGVVHGPFTRSAGPNGSWCVWLSEHGNPTKNPAGLFWVVNDIDVITGAIMRGAKEYTDPAYAGDGFAPDEHGDNPAHASRMVRDASSGAWAGVGVIERYTDKDVFALDWPGGPAWIGIQTAVPTPLLDARAVLYDAKGAVVAAADPPESMQVALRVEDLPAGTYYLEVSSNGDYSELGRYEATVSVAPPLALEPIALLPLDGEPLADTSGQGREVRWEGAAKWASEPGGRSAAAFNGANRILIRPGERPFVIPGRADLGRTFALWFKAGDAAAEGEQVLLLGPGDRGYRLYLEGGHLKARARNDGGLSDWVGGADLAAEARLESGRWYHAALTHRGTFSKIENTIALFLDGEEVARGGAGPVAGTSQLEIGGPGFKGAIDDVRILGEAVPAEQIAAIAGRKDRCQPRPADTGLQLTTKATHNTVALNCTPPGEAAGFEILRSLDNQHFVPVGRMAANGAFSDTGLHPSRRYFYAVRAAGGDKAGLADITTRSGPVDRPRFIRVVKDDQPTQWGYHRYGHDCEGEYGITLLWFGPHGHRDQAIRIERSTDGTTFKPLITYPARERVYYDTTVAPATEYTYRFVTVDDAGDSCSVTLKATSAPAKP
ncbi:MAG: LamG domain-containing protein [Akkermansiaceae bacterium]|nr:LamG domain-containing protein [Akkermansiaceae bacterium]